MQKLPGTTIESTLSPGVVDRVLSPLFLGGGLVLSQVAQLTGLEGHTIQNWVKRRYLPPPQGKRYTRRQFCRIVCINVLRDCFTLEQTAAILSYVNGLLADDSDDRVDDYHLYRYFVDCACATNHDEPTILSAIADYTGSAQDKTRLIQVLNVMLAAYDVHVHSQQALTLYYLLDHP